MPLTWMIVFGAFLIPFDSVNQKYLDNAYLSGELRIQVISSIANSVYHSFCSNYIDKRYTFPS